MAGTAITTPVCLYVWFSLTLSTVVSIPILGIVGICDFLIMNSSMYKTLHGKVSLNRVF